MPKGILLCRYTSDVMPACHYSCSWLYGGGSGGGGDNDIQLGESENAWEESMSSDDIIVRVSFHGGVGVLQ